MGDVTIYNKAHEDFDGLARGLRTALIVGNDDCQHRIILTAEYARKLVALIENRDRVVVVTVEREAIPTAWWVFFLGAGVLSSVEAPASFRA